MLAVMLVLEHSLDVRTHLLLGLLPGTDVFLEVQLHLGKVLVVLV